MEVFMNDHEWVHNPHQENLIRFASFIGLVNFYYYALAAGVLFLCFEKFIKSFFFA